MLNKTLIVCEGLPGAGKTSVLQALQKRYDWYTNIDIVPELVVPFDPLNENNLALVLSNDELKYYLYHNAPHHVIMDRGYPSTLNWDYVLYKESRPNNFKEKMNWYLEKINNKLFYPNIYLYFDVKINTSLQRKQLPPKIDLPWSRPESLLIAKFYYDYFFKRIEPHVPVIYVNAEAHFDVVVEQVFNIVTKCLIER